MEPEPPFYESFAEQQVRAGFYDDVIRYRADVRPLVNALWHQAGLVDVAGGSRESVAASQPG